MKIIPEINPERFTWEKCAARVGVHQNRVVTADWSRFQPGVNVLGYCDAIRLRVRPRNEGFAVLVEVLFDDAWEECWMHCNKLPIYEN